jgi:hypothetical protein
MKKTVSSFLLMFVLMFSITLLWVNSAFANPAPLFGIPTEPITSTPTVYVSSPIYNETYLSPHVLLNFTVTDPAAWFDYPNNSNMVLGNLTSVYYVVDGGERQYITLSKADTSPAVSGPNISSSSPPPFRFSIILNLTAGMHSVVVGAEAVSYYVLGVNLASVPVQGGFGPVIFKVEFPHPVIVSPESIVYNESSVPLAFSLGSSAISWVGYSLDGEGNVTIAGNTTLMGLTNGEHSITVYANDTLGNVYASQTINFTVASEAKQEAKPFPTITVTAVSAVSAALVIAGLIVYFKKRKPSALSKY